MALASKVKQDIIKNHGLSSNDTGSPEVQISLLTRNIESLTQHLKMHKKDFHSRRGLVRMVSKRRCLLDYLKAKYKDRYQQLIKELGLRK